MPKKVLLLNGSPRPNGNTARALRTVAEALCAGGVETEFVQLGGMDVRGCKACGACKNLQGRCVQNDGMNGILEKVWRADGLVIGSPTYFSNVTSETKAFIDRCGFVSGSNNGLLRGKVGAAVSVARRSGANFTFAAINFLFTKCEMPVASSDYWNMALARLEGEVEQDEEGLQTYRILGKNMAEMVKKLR